MSSIEGESYYSFEQGQAPGSLSVARKISDSAEEEIEGLVYRDPSLVQLIKPMSMLAARRALINVEEKLNTDPLFFEKLERDLSKISIENPGRPALYINSIDSPYVISYSKKGMVGFAPVLSCTLNAIEDFKLKGFHLMGIVNSDEDFISYVLERLNREESVIEYESDKIDPVNYVALASIFFMNETYRFGIRDGRLQVLERAA